jgi:tetratricopeptide (TPR) repeat protein
MNIQKLWVAVLGHLGLRGRGANPDAANQALEKGRSLFDEGDYGAAIAAFTQATGLNPKCAEAYCSRGDARREKDELDMAIADYTEAIRHRIDRQQLAMRAKSRAIRLR